MSATVFGRRTPIWAAFALLFAQVPAWAQGTLHARVSFDAGGTMVRGTEDSDWSHATMNTLILPGDTLWVDERGTTEIEMSGGTFVRMADGSKAEVSSFSPSIELRAWVGSVYVHRVSRSTGEVVVQTPAGAVMVDRDSSARIDMFQNGSTTVSVRWGSARVRGSGGPLETISARQRVYVDPGMLPSEVVSFDASLEDDFDAWNRERSRVLATGVTAVPESLSVMQDTIGVSELGAYGEWVTLDDGPYWRPTVADYVPYRDGHWSFVPSVGYTWIENYPFGYCTSHYGRWRYIERYGWCWRYDPRWAPAWCATIRYGDHFMWSPIGFDNQPVHVFGAATFDIGGVQFSVGATSYVPRDYLYYGGYVAPLRPTIVQDIDITNINIWNISLNDNSPYVNLPYRDKRMGVYSERPKRILRGPDRLEGKKAPARLIASNLEERSGKRKFEAEKKVERADARTAARPDEDRRVKREVRLDPKQRVAKRDPKEIKEETKARREAREKREEPVVAAFEDSAQDKVDRRDERRRDVRDRDTERGQTTKAERERPQARDQQDRDARASDQSRRTPAERDGKRNADQRPGEKRTQGRADEKRDLVPDQPGAIDPDRRKDRRRSGTPDEAVTPSERDPRAPKADEQRSRARNEDARREGQRRDAQKNQSDNNQARREAEARRNRQEQQRQTEKAAEAAREAERQQQSSIRRPRNTRDDIGRKPTDTGAAGRNTGPRRDAASSQARKGAETPPQQRADSGRKRVVQGETRHSRPDARNSERRAGRPTQADVRDSRGRQGRERS